MKRLDLKTEKAIRDLNYEKIRIKVFVDNFEKQVDDRFILVE